MQAKNETSRNFLIRTDALALRLGVDVQDLPAFVGIGRASLFCYRRGSRPISNKTWLKLEKAEREAGIGKTERHFLDRFAGEYDEALLRKILSLDSELELVEGVGPTKRRVWIGVELDDFELLEREFWSNVSGLVSTAEKLRGVDPETENDRRVYCSVVKQSMPQFRSWMRSFVELEKARASGNKPSNEILPAGVIYPMPDDG